MVDDRDCQTFAEGSKRLDSITIVNGRRGTQSATSAAVIEGDAIERLNALRLGDVLADVPGVFFSGLNGPRETPQIRNTLSFDNRTLFLEDGVPLQSSVFFDQSALGYSTALASPGAVEVLRGPGTALYGSDAFTGVIQARSQETSQFFEGNARARYGEFGLFDGAVSINAPRSAVWRINPWARWKAVSSRNPSS
ncbi:MAG: Plug domain-containing protein, partial [Pseudomonadota bacterium]